MFRDLRPYVCTFEDCQNAEKLYVTRHDWIYHELQIHRREYACAMCHKACSSRKDMSAHLEEHYDESILRIQLGVILDLCDRQADILDNRKHTCLICREELSLSTLQEHLAAHMEDLSLFVLPSLDEEEETGGSNASVQVEKLKSKGKLSDTESDTSSLGFSLAENHGQNSAEFVKHLIGEEPGYTSKVSSWKNMDKGQMSDNDYWNDVRQLRSKLSAAFHNTAAAENPAVVSPAHQSTASPFGSGTSSLQYTEPHHAPVSPQKAPTLNDNQYLSDSRSSLQEETPSPNLLHHLISKRGVALTDPHVTTTRLGRQPLSTPHPSTMPEHIPNGPSINDRRSLGRIPTIEQLFPLGQDMRTSLPPITFRELQQWIADGKQGRKKSLPGWESAKRILGGRDFVSIPSTLNFNIKMP